MNLQNLYVIETFSKDYKRIKQIAIRINPLLTPYIIPYKSVYLKEFFC